MIIDPFTYIFRGRRGELIKVLWWEGDGQFVREETGARKIYLAASNERDGVVDTSAVVDVVGRD